MKMLMKGSEIDVPDDKTYFISYYRNIQFIYRSSDQQHEYLQLNPIITKTFVGSNLRYLCGKVNNFSLNN